MKILRKMPPSIVCTSTCWLLSSCTVYLYLYMTLICRVTRPKSILFWGFICHCKWELQGCSWLCLLEAQWVGPAALAVLSFSVSLSPWGGQDGGNPRLTTTLINTCTKQDSPLPWRKVTKKDTAWFSEEHMSITLFEGRGGVTGPFYLMYSQPRWRGKEI